MSKMSPMGNKVPEMIWLFMSFLCLSLAIIILIRDGLKQSYAFFAFALISSLMVFLRRHIRKSSNNS